MPAHGQTLTVNDLSFVFRVVRPSETFLGRLSGSLCVNLPYVMPNDDQHPVYVLDARSKPKSINYIEPVLPGGY